MKKGVGHREGSRGNMAPWSVECQHGQVGDLHGPEREDMGVGSILILGGAIKKLALNDLLGSFKVSFSIIFSNMIN